MIVWDRACLAHAHQPVGPRRLHVRAPGSTSSWRRSDLVGFCARGRSRQPPLVGLRHLRMRGLLAVFCHAQNCPTAPSLTGMRTGSAPSRRTSAMESSCQHSANQQHQDTPPTSRQALPHSRQAANQWEVTGKNSYCAFQFSISCH